MKRSARVERLDTRLYPNYRSESDHLRAAIHDRLPASGRVLDIGCGGGELFPYDFRSPTRRVFGVDMDDAVRRNRRVDAAVFGSGAALPYADESFDLLYSRYVFEHLADPVAVTRECARVLRPGGALIVLTPNVRHYFGLLARILPNGLHKTLNARLRGRPETDTFPTMYRANTPGALRRAMHSAGLVEERIDMIETRPNYLMWHTLPYLAGVAYERAVNSTPFLAGLRINILATFRRPR